MTSTVDDTAGARERTPTVRLSVLWRPTERDLAIIERSVESYWIPAETIARRAGLAHWQVRLALMALEADGLVIEARSISRENREAIAEFAGRDPGPFEVRSVCVPDPVVLVPCDGHGGRCVARVEVPAELDGKADERLLESCGWQVRGLRAFCPDCRQGPRRVA